MTKAILSQILLPPIHRVQLDQGVVHDLDFILKDGLLEELLSMSEGELVSAVEDLHEAVDPTGLVSCEVIERQVEEVREGGEGGLGRKLRRRGVRGDGFYVAV
jgi:hypothetical protein